METVVEIKTETGIIYCPTYVINGEELLISHQGKLVYYETEQQAKEYFED